MSLPLRKDSVINEALQEATNRLRYRLHEAVKAYFNELQNTADGLRRREQPSTDDLQAYRAGLLRTLDEYASLRATSAAKLDAAVAAYDLGVTDLEAWITAAKAADKVRPGK